MQRPRPAALFLMIMPFLTSPAMAQKPPPNLLPPPTPLAGCIAAVGIAWAQNTLTTPAGRQAISDACKNVPKSELLKAGLLGAIILDLALSTGERRHRHYDNDQDMPFD